MVAWILAARKREHSCAPRVRALCNHYVTNALGTEGWPPARDVRRVPSLGWAIMVMKNAAVFGAIADPTRRAILDAIARREHSAGEIAELFPISRPAISRHIRVLRAAGLVRERRDAQSRLYSINAAPLRDVDRWLDSYKVFWSARLLDLKRVAEAEAARTPTRRT